MTTASRSSVLLPRASAAIDNLRAFVILLVLSFHAVLAYLDFLPRSPFPFDSPPYLWRAFPIVDTARWFGFDLFCAWQDVFLMSLFFFVSGLFVWRSIERKGIRTFLRDRIVRLGLPFAFVVALLMPIANYPTYVQTALDPSLAAFWRHWLALPFWPCGPMWFLWLLLMADFATAALRRFAPSWGATLIRFSGSAGTRPIRYFAVLIIASACAYVPLALAFTPSAWMAIEPFSLQLSRPLHYAVYFFAGVGLGAYGIERGLFAPEGALVRRWGLWLIAALGSLLVWMGLTALTTEETGSSSLGLQILDGLGFVLACFCSCFAMLALVLRFAGTRVPVLDILKRDAYGIYLVHYIFVVWLQCALLGAGLFALGKGTIVFGGTLLFSWGTVAAVRCVPVAVQVIGADRPRGAAA
jgi:glucans biosynthesis protein C